MNGSLDKLKPCPWKAAGLLRLGGTELAIEITERVRFAGVGNSLNSDVYLLFPLTKPL